jgi:DNA-binding MarR family transcriptional regulator
MLARGSDKTGHLRKLEGAGYVEVTKAYRRRDPVTCLALTRAGRRALGDYTASLRNLLTIPSHNGHTQPGAPREYPPDQKCSEETEKEISP